MILKRHEFLKLLAGAAVAGMVAGNMGTAMAEDKEEAATEETTGHEEANRCSGPNGCGSMHDKTGKTTTTTPTGKTATTTKGTVKTKTATKTKGHGIHGKNPHTKPTTVGKSTTTTTTPAEHK